MSTSSSSSSSPSSSSSRRSPLECFAIRLKPGAKIVESLKEFIRHQGISNAFILTCVGSVTHATLRLANATATNRNEILELNDRHEIVSLVGTFDSEQHCHLHTSLSDGEGKTIGGHVFEMTVFTTAEIVIGTAPLLLFKREDDPQTGFDELVIYSKEHSS